MCVCVCVCVRVRVRVHVCVRVCVCECVRVAQDAGQFKWLGASRRELLPPGLAWLASEGSIQTSNAWSTQHWQAIPCPCPTSCPPHPLPPLHAQRQGMLLQYEGHARTRAHTHTHTYAHTHARAYLEPRPLTLTLGPPRPRPAAPPPTPLGGPSAPPHAAAGRRGRCRDLWGGGCMAAISVAATPAACEQGGVIPTQAWTAFRTSTPTHGFANFATAQLAAVHPHTTSHRSQSREMGLPHPFLQTGGGSSRKWARRGAREGPQEYGRDTPDPSTSLTFLCFYPAHMSFCS